jgi:hypothetical protein
MPDDSLDLSGRHLYESATSEERASASYEVGRWAHFPAGLVFGLFFILFGGHPWRWYIAIDGGYAVSYLDSQADRS